MTKIALQDERGYNQIFAPVGATPVRMKRRSDWLVSQIGSGARVLEIGCGTGETAAYIASQTQAEVVAIDLSAAFVAEARRRHQAPNLRFEEFDLLAGIEPPFGRFDLVCGNGILHHLVKLLPEVLTSLRGLSNQGGRLAFIEPNLMNPYCAFIFGTGIGRRLGKLEPDEMAFTRGELVRALSGTGWNDIQVVTRDFLVPGIPLALVRPIEVIEPALEATRFTRWLAQSHFVTARG